MRRLSSYTFSLMLAGCLGACSGSGGGGEPEGADPLDTIPENMLPERILDNLEIIPLQDPGDLAIFTDIIDVGAGRDATYCTFGPILEEGGLFGESLGSQSSFGHHAIVQYTTEPREPGTRPCGANDMDFSQLLGGTGGKEANVETRVPDNVAVEIPPGAQIVINHHYINTSAESAEVQSMAVARRVEETSDLVLAGTTTMAGINWEIPARSDFTYTSECTFGADVEYFMVLGHMHEWGSYITIDVERTDGEIVRIVDQPWTADAATGDAPTEYFSLDDTLMIHEGDKVTMTCEWQNDTDEAIGFPREMCVFFGYTTGQNFVCGEGFWLTPDEAAQLAAESGFDLNTGL